MSPLDIGVLTAFAGGVLSFLSPCVLPLAPPYLAFLAGTTIDRITGEEEIDRAQARRVFVSSLFFVAGLATVFVTLGATASAAGQALAMHKYEFSIAAGFVIYMLGQHFIGMRKALRTVAVVMAALAAINLAFADDPGALLADYWPVLAGFIALAVAMRLSGYDHIPFLYREARFDAGGQAGSYAGAYVVGLAFAFGWTPCIGPILGTILALAAQEDTIARGVWMLSVYAAGLGLPFVLAALFVRPFMRFMRGFRRHMATVETAMGGLLIAVGVMMATGSFETLAYWLLETFPALQTIG